MSTARMESTPPGVFATAARAWGSTGSILARRPMTVLITAVVVAAFSWASTSFHVRGLKHAHGHADGLPLGMTLASIATELAISFFQILLVAPLAIATHRLVLLPEHAPRHPFQPVKAALLFALWGAAFQASNSLQYILGIFGGVDPLLVRLILLIVTIVATIRLALVFPAIAIEEPGAPATTSWHSTKGRFWRTAAVLFVTAIPVPVIAGVAVVLLIKTTGGHNLATLVLPLLACITVLLVVALAAAASWLFIGYR